jgi:hypothetical protein
MTFRPVEKPYVFTSDYASSEHYTRNASEIEKTVEGLRKEGCIDISIHESPCRNETIVVGTKLVYEIHRIHYNVEVKKK